MPLSRDYSKEDKNGIFKNKARGKSKSGGKPYSLISLPELQQRDENISREQRSQGWIQENAIGGARVIN